MAYVDLTLPEYQKRFSSEEACLDAIFEDRWPNGFICPDCGHNDGYRLSSRPRIVQCCNCRGQTSITANTLYHKSHLPLVTWFLIIYLVAQDKGGASALRLANQLGMHQKTVWSILQKIRIAMGERDGNLTLAGHIELDEAFFGGRTKRGNGPPKAPGDNKRQVLVLVESEWCQAGNLVMKVIEGDQLEDLKPIIAEKIESEPPGQWFRSDAWGSHHVVMQFGHRIQMRHIPNDQQDDLLRCVNLAVSNAKAFFKGTYHNFCKKHIQRYLDEFCYRWNRRHLFGQLASHLIAACALHPPVAYKDIPAPVAA